LKRLTGALIRGGAAEYSSEGIVDPVELLKVFS